MPQTTIFQGVAQVPLVRYVHGSFSPPYRDTGERVVIAESLAENRRSLLAGIVTGDCMAPEVEPGDIVVWDSARRDANDGEMVVVSHEGNVLVKRVYRDSVGLILLAANDGSIMMPNGAQLEGIVISIIKKPRRRPLHLG